MNNRPIRAGFVVVAAAAALVSGAGLGVASAATAAGTDISPWTTTHATDTSDLGRVTLQPFVITKKVDKSSPVLMQ